MVAIARIAEATPSLADRSHPFCSPSPCRRKRHPICAGAAMRMRATHAARPCPAPLLLSSGMRRGLPSAPEPRITPQDCHNRWRHPPRTVSSRLRQASAAPHTDNPYARNRGWRGNHRSLRVVVEMIFATHRAFAPSHRDPRCRVVFVRASPTCWNRWRRLRQCAGSIL